MTRKRGSGEGTISKMPGRELWCGRITVGRDSNGKQIRKAVYASTRGEVAKKLAKLQTQRNDGTLVISKMTVSTFLQQWLDSIALSVRPTTLASYTANIRLHVKPRIGRLKLDALAPAHVQGVYSEMAAAGLSPRMQ